MIGRFLKILHLKSARMVSRAVLAFRTTWLAQEDSLSAEQQIVAEHTDEHAVKTDMFKNRYTPRRLNVLLVLSVLMCGLLIKYLFVFFPALQLTDMPLIGSVILIALLSPALYAFFYTPMIRQFNKLKRVEIKMRELAHKDILTGLYNRRGFMSFADQLLKLSDRAQRGLILIYADLDNLKQINDVYGHEAGDRAIESIAAVLKETFRKSDIIGRVGGDEFAILAMEAKAESLDALRKRLKQNLKMTKYNIDSLHPLTFSLGIIYYNPEKPRSIEALLKSADQLMYEEKTFRTPPRVTPLPVGT